MNQHDAGVYATRVVCLAEISAVLGEVEKICVSEKFNEMSQFNFIHEILLEPLQQALGSCFVVCFLCVVVRKF